jgi:hypothetical protein
MFLFVSLGNIAFTEKSITIGIENSPMSHKRKYKPGETDGNMIERAHSGMPLTIYIPAAMQNKHRYR